MKTIAKITIVCIGIITGCIRLHAQVTIGCELNPVKGALLDLKTQAPDEDNVTSTLGGLLLPRVKLGDKNSFDEFLAVAGVPPATPSVQRDHIGLSVYNLTNDAYFHEGIYLWTGSEWRTLDYGKVLFLPAFRLDTIQGQTHTINLFENVYKLNFNPPTSAATYISSMGSTRIVFPEFNDNASDFYYVITNYDPAVFQISGITVNGEMSYSVKTAVSPANAFVNAVMIRK